MRFKKTLSAMLLLCMLCTFLPHTGFAFSDESYEENIKIADALGLIDKIDSKNVSDFITRAEFAGLITDLLNMGTVNLSNSNFFTDVTPKVSFASDINLIAQLGIVTGSGDSKFNPDKNITYTEAVTMLVNALGYYEVALEKGGYPGGYLSQAAKLKLNSGIAVSADSYVNVATAATMLLNAGDVAVAEYIYKGEGYSIEKGDTIFNSVHGIGYDTGVVSAHKHSSLNSDVGTGNDTVVIDGREYYTYNTSVAVDMLGRNVDYYYKKIGKKTYVLYMKSADSKVIEVSSDDVVSYENGRFVYFDSEKVREVSIPKSAAIIYNGSYTSKYTLNDGSSVFMPKAGRVLIIYNDSGSVDTVSITSYTNLIVSSVDATDEIIYDMYSSERNLDFGYASDNELSWIITDPNGNIKDISSIKKYNVISYAKSLDNDIVRGVVIDKNISGEIDEITNGLDTHITVSGKSIALSPTYISNAKTLPALGTEVTVYLDYMGKAADIVPKGNNDAVYGFLIKADSQKNGPWNLENQIKVLTLNSNKGAVEIFSLADKVEIDGYNYEGSKLLDYLKVPDNYVRKASNTYILQNNENFLEPYQTIRYKLDLDGKIDYIDTVRRGNKEAENTLTLACREDKATYYIYSNTMKLFYNVSDPSDPAVFTIDNNTLIASIPRYDNIDAEEYYTRTTTPKAGYSGHALAYTTNTDSMYPEFVHVSYTDNSGDNVARRCETGLVKSVTTAVDINGDVTTKLTYYSNLTEYSDYLVPGLRIPDGLKAGDIVQINRNPRNQIDGIIELVELDRSTGTFTIDSDFMPTTDFGSPQMYTGKLFETQGNAFAMTIGDGPMPESRHEAFVGTTSSTYTGVYLVTEGRNGMEIEVIPYNKLDQLPTYKNSGLVVPSFVKYQSSVPRMLIVYELD